MAELDFDTMKVLEKVDSVTEMVASADSLTLLSKDDMSNQQLPKDSPNSFSRLLSLPVELQLLIWEFVVVNYNEPAIPLPVLARLQSLPSKVQQRINDFLNVDSLASLNDTRPAIKPIFINCPCDSSYGGLTLEYFAARDAWQNGLNRPPCQPALTRVCRSIRADALPMFYSKNLFQAGYCYECDVPKAVKWLEKIGATNRDLMKNFYFFDANGRHDMNCTSDLRKLRRSTELKGMGAEMVSRYEGGVCWHGVSFGRDRDEDLVVLEALFREM